MVFNKEGGWTYGILGALSCYTKEREGEGLREYRTCFTVRKNGGPVTVEKMGQEKSNTMERG